MLEESMLSVMSSWCTPTMLFVFLNFMIVTIFVTSGFSHKQQPTQHHHLNKLDSQPQEYQTHTEAPFLQRSPSVLQRLKSINFYQYASFNRSHDSATVTNYESPMSDEVEHEVEYEEDDRFEHEEDEEEQEEEDRSMEEVYGQLQNHHVTRTKSDTAPASGAVPVKLVKKMKKSASSKSAFRHFSEAEVLEARRPATTREVKSKVEAEDEEVDSKADDFINKFKQQLKLQRLDSILRYKEMLSRGAAAK